MLDMTKEEYKNLLAERLSKKVEELNWEERGIVSGDPEVKIVLSILDLEIRIEGITGKSPDFPILN
tara:strand:- start:301 stop:498 length:198 start_codon:yes stop_codon:yes gene_type:complete